jgi:ribosomal protein S18 acetylase RimI-like enzyme
VSVVHVLRAYQESDRGDLVALTIETFRPFYEHSFPQMVEHDRALIEHQHGQWEQDYREQVPALHDPDSGRHVVVAVDGSERIVGYIAWKPDPRPEHAEIELLAVTPAARRAGAGSALMDHALAALRDAGYRYVGLGTGGDAFHEPARRLYESYGFHPIPIMGYLRSL